MTEDSIDALVGDRMTETEKKKGRKKRTHEVEKEHQDLYDTLIEEVFDPDWHRNTIQQHNDAYITAATELKGKKFGDRFEAEEALVDALIKYRTEAGLPVSKDTKHRHHIYDEVKHFLDSIDKGEAGQELAGKVDYLVKEGNASELLRLLHENEKQKNISGKITYELEKRLPRDKNPEFYQGLLKAHGNYTGKYFRKGDLAKYGHRDNILKGVAQLYSAEMNRMIEEYVDEHKEHKKGH